MDDIVFAEELPTTAEYRELRAQAGWGAIDEEIARHQLTAKQFEAALGRAI